MVEDLLSWMKDNSKDYTNTFRALNEETSSIFEDAKGKSWNERYRQRLTKEGTSKKEQKKLMDASNPKFILRNYLAQKAIEEAEKGNYSDLEILLEVLKKPFEENKTYEDYAKEPPDWGKKLEISCSS